MCHFSLMPILYGCSKFKSNIPLCYLSNILPSETNQSVSSVYFALIIVTCYVYRAMTATNTAFWDDIGLESMLFSLRGLLNYYDELKSILPNWRQTSICPTTMKMVFWS